jgi:hypothetical protein
VARDRLEASPEVLARLDQHVALPPWVDPAVVKTPRSNGSLRSKCGRGTAWPNCRRSRFPRTPGIGRGRPRRKASANERLSPRHALHSFRSERSRRGQR